MNLQGEAMEGVASVQTDGWELTLAERLKLRRDELEQAILTRVQSVSEPSQGADAAYVEGLESAVGAALDYGLSTIAGDRHPPAHVPPELLSQACQAARYGISLNTVLRRYFAGYTLLCDYLMREAEGGDAIEVEEFQRLTRSLATIFDQLVVVISDEYTREAEGRQHSIEHRRTERVRRLLAGDLGEDAELGYEFDTWHLGLIARGPGGATAICDLAAAVDRRRLIVRPGEEIVWAWLGGRDKLSSADLLRAAELRWPPEIALALGEPGHGLAGWRLSHQQANAALPVAAQGCREPIRYGDVALLASALGDDILARSLEQLYLSPLEEEQDDGAALRQTLQAYLATGRNVSSTAAALKVSRPTVATRLAAAEKKLGRPLASCEAELKTALRLWEVRHATPTSPPAI